MFFSITSNWITAIWVTRFHSSSVSLIKNALENTKKISTEIFIHDTLKTCLLNNNHPQDPCGKCKIEEERLYFLMYLACAYIGLRWIVQRYREHTRESCASALVLVFRRINAVPQGNEDSPLHTGVEKFPQNGDVLIFACIYRVTLLCKQSRE